MGSVEFVGSAVLLVVSTIVDPVGARSGDFSHDNTANGAARATPRTRHLAKRASMRKSRNILRPMKLHGQAARRMSEQGYAMAALLVALAIMAVAMTVVMPVWKQMAQR